jgi:hypothetical protein
MIFFKFGDMFGKGNNQISSYKTAYDVNNLNGVHYNESDLVIYHVLKKESILDGPVYLNETTSKYLDVFFERKHTDWYKSFEDRYTSTRIPAKACE